jgi:hypothetical protein
VHRIEEKAGGDRLTCRCWILGIALPAALIGAPSDDNAKVIEVAGSWEVSGRPGLVQVFDLLPAGSSLKCTSGRGGLTLFLTDGSRLRLNCIKSVQVPPPRRSPGTAESLIGKIHALFQEKGRLPPQATVVRGAGQGPVESVLVLGSRGRIDVSPSLGRLSAGVYWIHFNRVGSTADPERGRVNTASGFEIAVPGLKPGLYQVVVTSERDEPIGVPATVLIVSASGAESAGWLFREATKLASNPDATPDRNLRALALAAIARDLGLNP